MTNMCVCALSSLETRELPDVVRAEARARSSEPRDVCMWSPLHFVESEEINRIYNKYFDFNALIVRN